MKVKRKPCYRLNYQLISMNLACIVQYNKNTKFFIKRFKGYRNLKRLQRASASN